MESSVDDVLTGCMALYFTIRKEYKIRCTLCTTKCGYFYSMNDFLKHWTVHCEPNISLIPSSSIIAQTALGSSEFCRCAEKYPTLLIKQNLSSFKLLCNACENHNAFDSVENFILHFLESHQNAPEAFNRDGTVNEEIVGDNQSVGFKDISKIKYSSETSDSLRLSIGNESLKVGFPLEQVSHCAEISNIGQSYTIGESQVVFSRAELEILTFRNMKMNRSNENSMIDNRNISIGIINGEIPIGHELLVGMTEDICKTECSSNASELGFSIGQSNGEVLSNQIDSLKFYGKNSLENTKINGDDAKCCGGGGGQEITAGFFFGTERHNGMTNCLEAFQCNYGQNIFGANVYLERLELQKSENKICVDIPESISATSVNQNVSSNHSLSSSPGPTSTSTPTPPPSHHADIEVASTSGNSRTNSSSNSSGRKRRVKSQHPMDNEDAESSFRRRRKRFKASQDPISCPICSKFFSQMQSYNFHMKKFHPPTLCTLCNKDFKNTKSILQHLGTHRHEAHCPICHEDNLWFNKMHLKKHFHLLNCRKCDFFTTDEIELQTHQIVCGQFRCLLCNACFGDARAYRRHCFAYHENDEPFECAYCAMKFKFLNTMREHQRTCQHYDGN